MAAVLIFHLDVSDPLTDFPALSTQAAGPGWWMVDGRW